MVRTFGKTESFVAVKDLGGAWLVNFGKEQEYEPVYEEDADGNKVATGEKKATAMSSWYEEMFQQKPTLEWLTQLILNGGLQKTTVKELYDVASGLGYSDEETLPYLKRYLRAKIEDYDCSDAVNTFTLNGKTLWLPLEKRLGLNNSLPLEKEAGATETTLWYNGEGIVATIDSVIELLPKVELYAAKCHAATQQHLTAMEQLETTEAVIGYDYTSGYPEKVEI